MTEETPRLITDAIAAIQADIAKYDSLVGPSKVIVGSKLEERCALLSISINNDEPEIPGDLMELLSQDQRRMMLSAYLTILSMSIVQR